MDYRRRRKLVEDEAANLVKMYKRSGTVLDYTRAQLKRMGVPPITQYLKNFPHSEWAKRRHIYKTLPVEMLEAMPGQCPVSLGRAVRPRG